MVNNLIAFWYGNLATSAYGLDLTVGDENGGVVDRLPGTGERLGDVDGQLRLLGSIEQTGTSNQNRHYQADCVQESSWPHGSIFPCVVE